MKRRKRSDRRQATLQGWWKALPFLLIPFGAFLTETWLHTQILANGYRDWDLNGEIRAIEETIVQLEADLSRATNEKTTVEQASDSGFRRPVVPSIPLEITQEFVDDARGYSPDAVPGEG